MDNTAFYIPTKITYPWGTKIVKTFQRKKYHGTVRGNCKNLDNGETLNWVVYEDHDQEEMTDAEISKFVTTTAPGDKDNNLPLDTINRRYPIGTFIRKPYRGLYYWGCVCGHRDNIKKGGGATLNWVVHQDGDTEELTDYSLKKYVVHVPTLPTFRTTDKSDEIDTAAGKKEVETKKSSNSSDNDAPAHVPTLPTLQTTNSSNDVNAAAGEKDTETKQSSHISDIDMAGLVDDNTKTPATMDDAGTSPSDSTTLEVSISNDQAFSPGVVGASLLCFLRRKLKNQDEEVVRPTEV